MQVFSICIEVGSSVEMTDELSDLRAKLQYEYINESLVQSPLLEGWGRTASRTAMEPPVCVRTPNDIIVNLVPKAHATGFPELKAGLLDNLHSEATDVHITANFTANNTSCYVRFVFVLRTVLNERVPCTVCPNCTVLVYCTCTFADMSRFIIIIPAALICVIHNAKAQFLRQCTNQSVLLVAQVIRLLRPTTRPMRKAEEDLLRLHATFPRARARANVRARALFPRHTARSSGSKRRLSASCDANGAPTITCIDFNVCDSDRFRIRFCVSECM